jgi:hypothetical protein
MALLQRRNTLEQDWYSKYMVYFENGFRFSFFHRNLKMHGSSCKTDKKCFYIISLTHFFNGRRQSSSSFYWNTTFRELAVIPFSRKKMTYSGGHLGQSCLQSLDRKHSRLPQGRLSVKHFRRWTRKEKKFGEEYVSSGCDREPVTRRDAPRHSTTLLLSSVKVLRTATPLSIIVSKSNDVHIQHPRSLTEPRENTSYAPLCQANLPLPAFLSLLSFLLQPLTQIIPTTIT